MKAIIWLFAFPFMVVKFIIFLVVSLVIIIFGSLGMVINVTDVDGVKDALSSWWDYFPPQDSN